MNKKTDMNWTFTVWMTVLVIALTLIWVFRDLLIAIIVLLVVLTSVYWYKKEVLND